MIMEMFPFLSAFYNRASEDGRIGATHISLYMALVHQWNLVGGKNPFPIERDQVMRTAKISGRHTYNKCINNLKDYGYINYLPSSNSFRQSIVYLISSL